MLQSSDIIHITKNEDVEALRSLGITSPIVLVPNGINLDEFENMNTQEIAKKNLGLEKDKKYILFCLNDFAKFILL